ncbi:Symplekin, partial [Aphelenchoides avenae]
MQQFSLLTETKELLLPEANKLIALAFKRILDNEKRAVQGGAGADQQKLLVRLVTRYHSHLSNTFEEQLIDFIVQDQKSRTDLALLWLAELYAQMQGFSICSVNKNDGRFVDLERYVRYDKALCNLVGTLFNRGEHKETLFHRIFLEVPLITPAAQNWLKRACVDQVYGAFAMTTLRELILTRARQRNELLKLLLEFSYSERADIKEHCVKTAKELYQIDYIRDDVRAYVIKMSEYLVEPTVPKPLLVGSGRAEEEDADKVGDVPWDEPIIRAALHLFIAVLPHDHSLLHQLASVCARTTNEIKRVTFRNIEHAIKAIGMQSEALLDMIESCPTGAETLVARIVHLLTER